MSEDLAVINGDPADLAIDRVDRLGVLDAAVVEDWLIAQPEVDPTSAAAEGIFWTADGILADLMRVTGTDGRLRAVQVGISTGEESAYDDDRDHLIGALGVLARRLGGCVVEPVGGWPRRLNGETENAPRAAEQIASLGRMSSKAAAGLDPCLDPCDPTVDAHHRSAN